MQRRAFFLSGVAGLAAPAILRAATVSQAIVVGAGAAGITATRDLIREGVDVTLLEAAPRAGGRMMRLDGFADFPIDLGAEWIHTDPEVLSEIVGRDVLDDVRTIRYTPSDFELWHKGRLRKVPNLWPGYEEAKFYDTTWYGFFERYMWPDVSRQTRLNAPVSAIDYRGNEVRVTAGGKLYKADRVIVTVPLSVLKAGDITFTPAPPLEQISAVQGFNFGEGFKVFLRFKERFYPDILRTQSRRAAQADTWDDKTYYDAAFGKGAKAHVLGLFTASETQLKRTRMRKAELIKDVLAELDEIYEGAASRLLIKAEAKNWTQDPFIRGTYSMEYDYVEYDTIAEVFEPLGDRVFFAGEALGGDDQSTVHGAALSGRRAVQSMIYKVRP